MSPTDLTAKRIVVVLHVAEIGGAERQALLLSRYLKESAGANVALWVLGETGPLAGLCAEAGIPFRVVPVGWSEPAGPGRAGLIRLALALRLHGPDVLLPFTAAPNVACGLVWHATKAASCIWNQRDEGRFLADSRRVRASIEKTPWFIANARCGVDALVARGVAAERIRTIENGIEPPVTAYDRATWRRRLDVPADAVVFVMVANLHRYKDHETLLTAWRTVMRSQETGRPVPVLVLAGRPGDRAGRIDALARELGIADSLRVPGFVDDVGGLLGAADAGVLSSRTEGTPNAVLEYMASGLPVVATDLPSIREVLAPDQQDFLAAPGDAEALAGRMLGLLASPDARSALGSDNAALARERFSPERMGARFAEAIAAALAPDRGVW